MKRRAASPGGGGGGSSGDGAKRRRAPAAAAAAAAAADDSDSEGEGRNSTLGSGKPPTAAMLASIKMTVRKQAVVAIARIAAPHAPYCRSVATPRADA